MELEIKRKALDILPYVSIGSASFAAGDDVLKVKEIADSIKKERKEQAPFTAF